MQKLDFKIAINASINTVYSITIDKRHFPIWTEIFAPNSHFEGSWDEGKILIYKCPDEKGKMQGMVNKIMKNKPNREIFIQPIGIIEDGKEIHSGEKVKDLDESFENYLFEKKGDGTELHIRVSVFDKFEDYFNETWPKALEKLKFICENKI